MKEQIIEILYDSLNEFARNLTKYDYNKTAEKILNLLTEDGYKKMTNTWCAYCGKEFPLDTVTADQVGEHIATCDKHPLFLANKRIKELETAILADATDLWGVTNGIIKEIASREWIMEGRGCYAWDDNRYKDETRLAFEAVLEILKKVQYPAQLRFNAVIK
jgi:hypothetical protein